MKNVSYAVVHTDPPQVFMGGDDRTLSRLLGLQLVAQTAPSTFGNSSLLESVRQALLNEQWGDAVARWIEATGCPVDVYSDGVVWEADPSDEITALEIQFAPIFSS